MGAVKTPRAQVIYRWHTLPLAEFHQTSQCLGLSYVYLQHSNHNTRLAARALIIHKRPRAETPRRLPLFFWSRDQLACTDSWSAEDNLPGGNSLQALKRVYECAALSLSLSSLFFTPPPSFRPRSLTRFIHLCWFSNPVHQPILIFSFVSFPSFLAEVSYLRPGNAFVCVFDSSALPSTPSPPTPTPPRSPSLEVGHGRARMNRVHRSPDWPHAGRGRERTKAGGSHV